MDLSISSFAASVKSSLFPTTQSASLTLNQSFLKAQHAVYWLRSVSISDLPHTSFRQLPWIPRSLVSSSKPPPTTLHASFLPCGSAPPRLIEDSQLRTQATARSCYKRIKMNATPAHALSTDFPLSSSSTFSPTGSTSRPS